MSNRHPILTVITVVFNDAENLENTIQSVLNQTYKYIEYIIIDGGSSDGTIEIIKKYSNSISNYISEPDNGIYYAMNKGIDLSTGQWINFMNSGDWFYSSKTIENVFDNRCLDNVDFIFGNTEKRLGLEKTIFIPTKGNRFYERLLVHQSLFSRAELNRTYKFDTNFKVSADFDFIFKVFLYKKNGLYIDLIVSSFDLIGYSHHQRYLGFQEDRKIALKYKGNFALSYRVYIHYFCITIIGKVIDCLKLYCPNIYKRMKNIKRTINK